MQNMTILCIMYRYADWGEPLPHRPAQDSAFAVARFYQRGGSLQNYYMVRTKISPRLKFRVFFSIPFFAFSKIRLETKDCYSH